MEELYKELKKFGQVKLNEPLSKHTTFKIGGPADLFVEVNNNEQLVDLLNYLSGQGVDYLAIGGGSNLLFKDEGFRGVVIKILSSKFEVQGSIITADAGVALGQVVALAAQNGLSGMEWGIGIPGTVGGAVRGNAGAWGKDTSGTILKVKLWRDGEVVELDKEEMKFSYRHSCIKSEPGPVVLQATFQLTLAPKQEIMAEMQKLLKQRSGHPNFPSAGSFFQNIDLAKWPGDIKELPPIFVERKKVPVGWIMEQLGLKGFTVGGAKISDEHGNFLINYQNATQADILNLIEQVQEKVYNKFKVALIPEVEILS